MSRLKQILCALSAAATSLIAVTAFAQADGFPNKQITIVVPFPPGGTADQLARGVGGKMAENLKVPVIIDNKPGGGAQIGANAVKQAPADGYTIFIGDIGALALNPSLYPKLSYDPLRDFMPLARLTLAPMLLLVTASSPLNNMADLVKAAKTKAEGLSIASQGNGTGGHLIAEMLRTQTQGKLNHVPYRGSAPALQDLMGGQVEVFFDPIFTAGPYVKDGKLKALAVGTEQRSAQFPQVPTLKELGYDNINLVPWFGMVVKAGTPEATVKRLSDEVIKALRAPEVAKRFTDLGLEVAPQPTDEFRAFMQAEAQRWGKVIKAAGIKLE